MGETVTNIKSKQKAHRLKPDHVVLEPGEMGAILELTVKKKDGTIREHRVQKAESFVRQFLDLLMMQAAMANETTLRLDVTDDGPGISLEDQIMIFEEFRQARSTQPGEGTGLGLAISRRLVELHSGRIWGESELGEGATFTVLLPVAGPELDALN